MAQEEGILEDPDLLDWGTVPGLQLRATVSLARNSAVLSVAADAAGAVAWDERWQRSGQAAAELAFTETLASEEKAQRMLARDIVGPLPFRPVRLDRTRLTSTVEMIAESIYREGDFAKAPILADALEDAGCDNADILNHSRQPGEHVRGCWVIDSILGKE